MNPLNIREGCDIAIRQLFCSSIYVTFTIVLHIRKYIFLHHQRDYNMNVCLNYIIFIALSYLIVLAITLSKEYVKLALFFRSRVYLLVLTLMQPYEGKVAKVLCSEWFNAI